MTREEIMDAMASGTLDELRQHGVCVVCGKPYDAPRNVRVCGMQCSEVVRWCRNHVRSEKNLKATGKRCGVPRKPKAKPHVLRSVSLDTKDPWLANYGGGWVNADPVLGF